MNIFTVFLSALSLYLNHHRTSTLTPVPYWMKIIFLYALPTCLFLSKPCEPPRQRQRRITSFDSPLLLRKIKESQFELPIEMSYLIEQFLESSNDIKYISETIHRDTEEMKVRENLKNKIDIFLLFRFIMIGNIFPLS
jgi:hypothetical protein